MAGGLSNFVFLAQCSPDIIFLNFRRSPLFPFQLFLSLIFRSPAGRVAVFCSVRSPAKPYHMFHSNITASRGWKQLCLHARSTRSYLPRSILNNYTSIEDILTGMGQAVRVKPVSQEEMDGWTDEGRVG